MRKALLLLAVAFWPLALPVPASTKIKSPEGATTGAPPLTVTKAPSLFGSMRIVSAKGVPVIITGLVRSSKGVTQG